MHFRLRFWPVLLVVALLLLAGCGGGDGDQEVAAGGGDAGPVEDGASPSPSASVSPPAANGAPGSPAPAEDGTGAPATSGAGSDGPGSPAEPPFEANTRPDTADPEGYGLSVTDVEIGRHEGYDRVVFTLGGEGVPGWRVEYVDRPTRQGSGHPFTPAGDAFLSVLVTGVGYPFDTGVEEYDGPRTLSGRGTEVAREVQVQGVFEGQYDGAIGLTAVRPFRVFRLDGPPRVVIDVAHRG